VPSATRPPDSRARLESLLRFVRLSASFHTVEYLMRSERRLDLRRVVSATDLWREGPLTFDLPALPVHPDMVPPAKATANVRLMTRDELKRQEREAIINALKQTNGKVSGPHGAAQLLGMKPSTLSARISSLGINRRTIT
jgi:transcriptional regulator with GAF, ATPase, and Fis domain